MTVRTSYFTALANEDVEPGDGDRVYAVVQYTQGWIDELVDRNIRPLAPPERLLNAYKSVEEAADREGYSNPSKIAWESVNFEDRYLKHLRNGASDVVDVVAQEAAQTTVWLVCWEKDDRCCHRRLLADYIDENLEVTSTPRSSWGIGRTCPHCETDSICSIREFKTVYRHARRESDVQRVLKSDADHICSNCFAGFGRSSA
jgi:uncharacterized protein YeaO (DUF488 family)